MSLTVNTNIINDTDQYLLDAKNVKGTFVVVENTTEMNTLKTLPTIINGSLCYNQADQLFYQYNNNAWNQIQFGGGGGSLEGIIVTGGTSSPSTITDLTGFTWTGKNIINLNNWPFIRGESGDFSQVATIANITFVDATGQSYTGMSVSSSIYGSDDYYSDTLYYEGSRTIAAYEYESNQGDETEGWNNGNYQTIKFTGGSDATNSELINYLQNNGTLSRTSYKVTVLGTLSADAFYALSDARLKENFVPFTSNTSILDLPIYTYDFINSPLKNQIGCKAQDLQQICPEIVQQDNQGCLSIQENKIVYLLIDEIKKLKQELQELRGK